jgi:rubrerythrin
MDSEQSKILEALQFSIQMEIDGKKYYQNASQKCEIKVGRDLFEWLADQEDRHLQKFEQIYKDIKDNKSWPEIEVQTGRKGNVDTIFSQARNAVACKIETRRAELDTIAKAMEMENKTQEFYKKQGEIAVYEVQGKFYKALAAEEQKHYLALVDYREYLIDPVDWFTKVEHHSLDGG